VQDGIHFTIDLDKLRHVMLHELEALDVEQMNDVVLVTSQEVVDTEDGPPLG
jgi:hypothetical protein